MNPELKDKILAWLKDRYNNTGFPYTAENDIETVFGNLPRDELNALFLEKKIRVREGMKRKIVELLDIPEEDKEKWQ